MNHHRVIASVIFENLNIWKGLSKNMSYMVNKSLRWCPNKVFVIHVMAFLGFLCLIETSDMMNSSLLIKWMHLVLIWDWAILLYLSPSLFWPVIVSTNIDFRNASHFSCENNKSKISAFPSTLQNIDSQWNFVVIPESCDRRPLAFWWIHQCHMI